MKKLLFTLLLGSICFAAYSQDTSGVRDRIKEYLTEEGYAPRVDEDGDLTYKIEGSSYYIFVDWEEDNRDYYITVARFLYTDETGLGKAAYACNRISREYKIVQCYYRTHEDSDRISYTVSASCFADSAGEFLHVYPRLLSCVKAANAKLVELVNE